MDKLRIWWIQNPPADPQYFEVKNIEEAINKLNNLNNSQIGGLEIFDSEDDWIEYYDEQYRDIWGIIENQS